MTHARLAAAAALLVLTFTGLSRADEVRYVKENGVTYREVVRTTRAPTVDVAWQNKQETVLKQEYVTEFRESNRTVFTPVTEYRWEPRLHGRWNPFMEPYVAYHMIPHTRWESRVEAFRTPVSYSRYTPETRTVQTPQRTLGFQERKVVVERVAVAGLPAEAPSEIGRQPASVASRVGGIAALESDPPRRGAAANTSSGTLLR